MTHQTDTDTDDGRADCNDERLSQLAQSLDCITDPDLGVLTKTTDSTRENWRKRGIGPAYILAGNNYLYPRASVREWLHGQVRERRSVSPRAAL